MNLLGHDQYILYGTLLIVLQLAAGVSALIVKEFKIGLLTLGYAVCNAILYFMQEG